MPPSGMRELKSALEKRSFAPAYLFHGDDDYLKEDKVRAVIARATDEGTRDFNLEVRRAQEVDGASLTLTLSALPMMSERRVVILRDVAALKKDARTALGRYLAHPAPDLVLVLVALAGTKPDAELIAAVAAIEFKPLNDDDVLKWVAQRVGTMNVSITADAARLLVSATGNDLALLDGELDKLRSFTNGAEIDAAAVGAVAGVRHGETLGDLLDLAAQREGLRAIALLEPVLAQPKTSGVSIVMALTTQMLAIGWALSARDRGLQRHRLESEFFGLLKENPSSLVGRPWGEAVKGWVRAMRHWDAAGVRRAIALLAAADASLKDTKVSSEEQVLASLLLALSAPAARRVAA